MTSAEVAAWVQAVGSILAIAGALGAAIWQARLQHKNALALIVLQQRQAQIERTRTLNALVHNAASAVAHATGLFNTRQAVHDVAEGRVNLDRGELERVDNTFATIPLHDLPSALVSPTMVVASVVRQFREKVELVISAHRHMHGEEFDDLFRVLGEMNNRLLSTSDDIVKIAAKIEHELAAP